MRSLFLFLLVLSFFLSNLQAQKTYIFATYTYADNDRLQNLQPLVAKIAEKTGLDIQAKSYPSVNALLSAIRNDSVDFAMINTSGYLTLDRTHPQLMLPLLNLDLGGISEKTYGGCLIAGRKSGIKTLKDLKSVAKKYSLALVSPSSTSGNLVPRLILNANGIADPDSQFNVRYSGTHRNVVEEIINGQADLGACGCPEIDSAKKYLNFDNHAVVIESFDNIPLGPVLANRKLNKELIKKFTDILSMVHLSHPAIFSNFCAGWTEFRLSTRFRTITDKEYSSFRSLFGDNEQLWKMIE